MKKLAITLLFGVAFCSMPRAAEAQYICASNGACVVQSTTCCTVAVSSGCCYATDDSYTARVARWAIDLQLHNWLAKKPEELTRDDIKADRARLDVLCKWAEKEVVNKVFSQAYLAWASEMKSTLNTASTKLDHDEIASALLLHGLPTIPDGAK